MHLSNVLNTVYVRAWTALACAVFAWGIASHAHALGSCGTGGVQGKRQKVTFGGSVYYVTTPADYSDDKEWPIIFGLHGDEGDPAQSVNYSWTPDWGTPVADGSHIFIAPKAENASGSWYEATKQNTAFMDMMYESIISQYNVDLDRVYIWGLSGGAEFISGYALLHQDRYAAAQWNMGGNQWGFIGAGSPSPETCKLPGRFVVSLNDFLRDGALGLYDTLTMLGHETVWLDAACDGHCWDDVESGPGGRDWLMGHTLCGMKRPVGCEGQPATEPPPAMEPGTTPAIDPGMTPEMQPGVPPTMMPGTAPVPAGAAGAPGVVPDVGAAGSAAPVPTWTGDAAGNGIPMAMPSMDSSSSSSGCTVQTGASNQRANRAWHALIAMAIGLVGLRLRSRVRRSVR